MTSGFCFHERVVMPSRVFYSPFAFLFLVHLVVVVVLSAGGQARSWKPAVVDEARLSETPKPFGVFRCHLRETSAGFHEPLDFAVVTNKSPAG